MIAYRCLRGLLRFAVRIFFRRLEVVGLEHVPESGPIIFCGNHPNSLLDPILITCLCGRIVHFAAKDTLFDSRILRFFLEAMGSVPVRRRMDHGGDKVDNADAFTALYDVLAEGRTMGIFPEGISHDESQLSSLKTGAARIAFGVRGRYPEARPMLIPCGLYYANRRRFRSSALLQFGPPIPITDALLEAWHADPRAAARSVTDELELALRALTVNGPDWETVRVLDGVRRLYQPPKISLEQRVELARRFNDVYPQLAGEAPIAELYGAVEAYLDRLDMLGLNDKDLLRQMGPLEILARGAGHAALAIFWLPLALVGALLHLPVGLLMGWIGRRFVTRKDVVATTKFVGSFLTLLFAYSGLFAVLAAQWSWWAGLTGLILLPLSGFALLKVLDRARALTRLFASTTQMFLLGRTVDALREERAALEQRVVQTVASYLPEDLEPLFPERIAASGGAPTWGAPT